MSAEEEVRARRYTVSGRVQGVGFRWWTRRTAEEMGVSGAVANERDGSVTVVAAATRSTLALFEKALREGPRFARVESLEVVDLDDAVIQPGFAIETESRI